MIRSRTQPATVGESRLPAVLEPILADVHRRNLRRRARVRGAGTKVLASVRGDSFTRALAAPGVSVVAEAKRCSPSAGTLTGPEDVVERVRRYALGGACAASILTEPSRFSGARAHLRRAARALELPLLRKDFIVDSTMVDESAGMGASAVLLIARCLSPATLRSCVDRARELGLASLVEIHDERELEAAVATCPDVIGVNARCLDTLEVDLEQGLDLLERVPSHFLRVAESGIMRPSDVTRARNHGADAVLVGTAFMQSVDPRASVAAFARAGRGEYEGPEQPGLARPLEQAVKVCGLTRAQDVAVAIQAGADLVGFVVEPTSSPRAISIARCRELCELVPAGRGVVVTTEGLPDRVAELVAATGAHSVQLCGPARAVDFVDAPFSILRAVEENQVDEMAEWDGIAAGFVVEPQGSRGGSGRATDPNAVVRLAAPGRALLLAGGLSADDTERRLGELRRRSGLRGLGADASSRLETSPGVKDAVRVRRFVASAKAAGEEGRAVPCS
ncbi:Indole-3-glycerol phosphate synthase [Planctomycetes bacterium Pla163]|uniref:N-(5'-phosphoribosyl)anthranilate isomerase n=1 Tax=Rohdeia mirabilis TaxID=2528008 RepID=A0A518CYW2_9BACT|nr:Indole-3-glycerol phosphate synthase [Planctomycetes bacterium Pla163]